jgi:uncharacterized protein (TIGR03790 family)
MSGQLWGTQAASLPSSAACRRHLFSAGSLCSPELTRRLLWNFALMLIFACVPARAADEQRLAAATIVVYNAEIPESTALAKFYAEKRGIPRDHLVPLYCSADEEIGRAQFDTTIAEPLRAAFIKKHWWVLLDDDVPDRGIISSSIRFVALIKGVPLKIRSTTDYPGDKPGTAPTDRNEASVDSELTTLARFSRRISGPLTNPYFQSSSPIAGFGDSSLLLVCRLDGPTVETVQRMIVDSIAAEKNGLWGRAYVDQARNSTPGFEVGDKWLEEITAQLHKVGVPVVEDDTPSVFVAGFPISDCALYYGWYAGNVAGPFTEPDFRFVPGAVAVHIHSFSAATLRDPNANWVGPLLTKGAAASLGNVYEPYLQLTANLNIFNDRLLRGFTLAESAYMSLRGLSWMAVVAGDPLYRPYASWSQLNSKKDVPKAVASWKMYHDFAVKNSDKPDAEYRTLARQLASRSANCPMLEDLGLMAAHEGNWAETTNYFQQVRACYTKREDILRAVLEEANAWVKQQDSKHALALIRNALRVVSDGSTAELLRQKERELSPPAPTASPSKP